MLQMLVHTHCGGPPSQLRGPQVERDQGGRSPWCPFGNVGPKGKLQQLRLGDQGKRGGHQVQRETLGSSALWHTVFLRAAAQRGAEEVARPLPLVHQLHGDGPS